MCIRDRDGTPVSITDYQGKTILVNLWATWCEPCREEMPALGELHRMFPDSDFEVIGVSIDDPGSEQPIMRVMEADNVTYPVWLDPENRFQFAFRTIGVPESFLIDEDGQIIYHWKGEFDPVSEDTINLVQSTIMGTSYQSSEPTILSDGLIAGFVIGVAASNRIAWLKKLFTPQTEMREEVINNASQIFYDQRVHHTLSESGVLIFISFLEKRAVILADEKIEKDLGIETIESLCQKLTTALKEKQSPADSMINIIEEAGSLLADLLPRGESDENELSDVLVCID